jgi:redox-sensitive bicupin YhaK (pirin superfamily)
VTIVYDGEVEHRDSTGAGGTIGPGDVQWMTAAKGILHEEFHSQAFARSGGVLEMVQLWVNLPAKDKMAARPLVPDHRRRRYPRAGAGQRRRTPAPHRREFAGTQGHPVPLRRSTYGTCASMPASP